MEMASFNGFLKTLFYIILFYYIAKFLVRLFLPIVVKKVVQKAGENFQKQYQNNQQQNPFGFDNDQNNAASSKNTKPRETKKVGEYIDYEEIE
jgi:hypothetical protein